MVIRELGIAAAYASAKHEVSEPSVKRSAHATLVNKRRDDLANRS